MSFVTRFAPSPTGPLHLGHAYSAMLGHDLARKAGGTFLLRFEDIDRARARPEWERGIEEDLAWLGLDWPRPVLRQSERMAAYAEALDALWARGLLYPCTCRRRDILAAATAPQEGAPLLGPDGVVYPGTCRHRPAPGSPRPQGAALRLHMAAALEALGLEAIEFVETGLGDGARSGQVRIGAEDLVAGVGDVVLARRDFGTSYHLAVTVDDAAQGITDVVRGQDLFEATAIHVLLQRLLGLPTPRYHHHRLIRDETGKRLAKRDDARALATLRAEGLTPAHLRARVGLPERP